MPIASDRGRFSVLPGSRLCIRQETVLYLAGQQAVHQTGDQHPVLSYPVLRQRTVPCLTLSYLIYWRNIMREYKYLTLRDKPELKDIAADWFHNKWGVPTEAYLACMNDYLDQKTEYGWYLCMDGNQIIAGMGVIENDFHDRKDLKPNVCAVYTEEEYRGQGIAGKLLDMTVEDLRSQGITPVYLVTDHIGFYERYGWEFLCMVQGDDEPEMTRMYIHR